MNRFFGFLNRVFTRRKPRPTPSLEYHAASTLPADPDELVRLGVIAPWRVMAATNEAWYTAERGAVDWYVDSFGGARDE